MMERAMKPTEYKLVYIRRANAKEPAELVLSPAGKGDEQIIVLRPGQLDGLIRDGVAARFLPR